MKQHVTRSEELIAESNRMIATPNEARGIDAQPIAHQLRALGQALEKFSFSAFDLELRSGTYLVTGHAMSTEEVSNFLSLVSCVSCCAARRCGRFGNDSSNAVELHFSSEEIERFDVRGKVKRQDSSKMPDPYSISQILRGAGSYVDSRDGTTLMGISFEGNWVAVSYQTVGRPLGKSQQDLEYFYDFWVKMYLRRSNRVKLPPPSDPTVLVTWRGIQKAHGSFNVPA